MCLCVGVYLRQQSGDKVFVFFTEPLHDVDQTLQSRLRESNTDTKIRSDRTANHRTSSRLTLVLLERFLSTWQSHPLGWRGGVFQSLKQDDFKGLQIGHNKRPTLISLSSTHLLQHAVRLLLHARLLGLEKNK